MFKLNRKKPTDKINGENFTPDVIVSEPYVIPKDKVFKYEDFVKVHVSYFERIQESIDQISQDIDQGVRVACLGNSLVHVKPCVCDQGFWGSLYHDCSLCKCFEKLKIIEIEKGVTRLVVKDGSN